MEIKGYFRCQDQDCPSIFHFLLYRLVRNEAGVLQWEYLSKGILNLPYNFKLPDGAILIRDCTPEEGEEQAHTPIPYKDTDLEHLSWK